MVETTRVSRVLEGRGWGSNTTSRYRELAGCLLEFLVGRPVAAHSHLRGRDCAAHRVERTETDVRRGQRQTIQVTPHAARLLHPKQASTGLRSDSASACAAFAFPRCFFSVTCVSASCVLASCVAGRAAECNHAFRCSNATTAAEERRCEHGATRLAQAGPRYSSGGGQSSSLSLSPSPRSQLLSRPHLAVHWFGRRGLLDIRGASDGDVKAADVLVRVCGVRFQQSDLDADLRRLCRFWQLPERHWLAVLQQDNLARGLPQLLA